MQTPILKNTGVSRYFVQILYSFMFLLSHVLLIFSLNLSLFSCYKDIKTFLFLVQNTNTLIFAKNFFTLVFCLTNYLQHTMYLYSQILFLTTRATSL